MILSKRLQNTILVLGDLSIFYLSLLLTLFIRYSLKFPFDPNLHTSFAEVWNIHKWPFFYVHIIWIVIFYINGLYDIKSFPSPKKVLSKILEAMAIGGLLATLLFYLIPFFEITPKTNMFLDVFLATALLMPWRRFFWLYLSKSSKIKILFFGASKEVEELLNHIKINTQLGYEPAVVLAKVDHNLISLIREHNIQLIVASKNIMENETSVQRLYESLPLGVSVVDFPGFYEAVVEKIPVSSIGESWFLVNLVEIRKQVFELGKRAFDIVFSVLLGIISVIIAPVIILAVKIESKGPVFYRQKRTGKNEKVFEIVKFRSMIDNAEKNGAQWADEEDERITKIGRILRKTRLDELPQLWNVLKGDMSFIGPRPERPEFVQELQKQIPHYAMRHLIKPGLSGWAQIKFPYGASVEDSMEKLQYDLYYIKNRSLILDLAIALRTLAIIISHQGR